MNTRERSDATMLNIVNSGIQRTHGIYSSDSTELGDTVWSNETTVGRSLSEN